MAETIMSLSVELRTNKRSPSMTLQLYEDETLEEFADRVRAAVIELVE
jgi:predicted ATPase with chaperone activity